MAGKVPVTRRAVIQRVNRKLKSSNQVLKISRGGWVTVNFGDYYVLDVMRNNVISTHVDVEKMARKIGALDLFEVLHD